MSAPAFITLPEGRRVNISYIVNYTRSDTRSKDCQSVLSISGCPDIRTRWTQEELDNAIRNALYWAGTDEGRAFADGRRSAEFAHG